MNSIEVLESILERNPKIEMITASSYPPVEHRVYPKNHRFFVKKDPDSGWDLASNMWNPRIEKDFEGKVYMVGADELIAVGCICLGWTDSENRAGLFCVPMVDFECEIDPINFSRMVNILRDYPTDWYLLQTSRSYHLYVEAIIPLNHLSWCYGDLIARFAQHSPVNLRHVFLGIGQDLRENYKNLNQVRGVCADILSMMGHVDEPFGGGLSFIIDLRHMAHTLIDVVNTIEGDISNVGVLRVNDGPGHVIPVVKAYKRGKVTVSDFGGFTRTGQLRLDGI